MTVMNIVTPAAIAGPVPCAQRHATLIAERRMRFDNRTRGAGSDRDRRNVAAGTPAGDFGTKLSTSEEDGGAGFNAARAHFQNGKTAYPAFSCETRKAAEFRPRPLLERRVDHRSARNAAAPEFPADPRRRVVQLALLRQQPGDLTGHRRWRSPVSRGARSAGPAGSAVAVAQNRSSPATSTPCGRPPE